MRATFCALACAFLLGCDTPGMVIGKGIPEAWSHKELTEHLNKKGVKVQFITATSGGLVGPSGFFVTDPLVTDLQQAESVYKSGGKGVVYCALKKTTQDAKDQAGTYGDSGFANGRFVFGSADKESLDQVRKSLP